MLSLIKYPVLYAIGGSIYFLIEILWRGYSHISMFFLGGLCFVLVGLINENYYSSRLPLLVQQILSTFIITSLELAFGLVLNVWLGLNIWDYSGLRFNFMGQICLRYSIFWFILSLPAIVLDDYLRHLLFGEEKPTYRFF